MTERYPSRGIGRKLALPASVLLNLFLIALIGGHFLRESRLIAHINPAVPYLSRALATAEGSMSSEDAKIFRETLKQDEARYHDSARQLEHSRADLDKAILADPFDKDAAKRALDAWQLNGDLFLNDVKDSLIDALAGISPDGRKRLIAQRHQSQGGGFRAP